MSLTDGTKDTFVKLGLGFLRVKLHRNTRPKPHVMIPMTPSSSVAYRELDGEEGTYWPSSSPGVPLSTSGDEGTGTKVRKPYTITKQRERWTEEEHQKFLEALKLYGRAWRRIEEHIGTKTAVQIRSHAQKFFSKIERDVTQQGGAETGVAQVIDIPPPRPKRKPTHPYPRKAGRSFGKTSEDECSPLAAAGSISSSSGISTVNTAEGCSKSSVWEQDDAGEACHQDVVNKDAAKANPTDGAPWGIPKQANTGSPPAIVAPSVASPVSNNQSPVPVAFPATMPWARIFGGAMNPAMMNPAMMSPALMNPAMMNPAMINPAMLNPQSMGMMMPWAAAAAAASGASNANSGMENGGAASAIAATIAAASAWWAMQGGMPPGVMHPALGAMYLSGGPPLAIPTPYLFSQCTPQEVTVVAASCGEAKENNSGSAAAHVADDGQEIPSANGNTSRSSALRRAERAQRVKELKARRMGSGNHLLSVSSDICASTSGGSGTNPTAAQVTNLSSESTISSLSKGVSLPANLNKAKQSLHDLVRKDREAPADGEEGGDDKRKRPRFGARASTDTVMLDVKNSSPSTTGQALNAHLEKVRSISGSNNLSGQFTKILERSSYDEEPMPTDASQSCGSDGSEGAGDAQAVGNERRGPSSNSSACGNVPGGTDRSGSSDGSSDGEATCNPDGRQRDAAEKIGRSAEENSEGARQFTFNEFLPVSKDGEKYEKHEGGSSSRLPRTVSIDGEQRKEVTERGQIAFQALFKRDTLPRTFSPPPGLTLVTEPKEAFLPEQPSSVINMPRSRSAIAMDAVEVCSPRQSRIPESAFNSWDHLRGTSSASKLDRCESGFSIPSPRPTKSLEELQSSERRRNNRKGRTHSNANNWLQLAPTPSLEKDEEGDEDESADSGADDRGCQKQLQQQESFVCKLDLSMAGQNEDELNNGSDTDGPGTTSLDLNPRPTAQSLSLSIGSCMKQHNNGSSVSNVSNRNVKYSGEGFVPYQRAPPPRVEPPVEKNC